jgi:hypothetical protein
MYSGYIVCRDGATIGKGMMTKEQFTERVSYLKQCGKRLGEIRKQVADEKFTKEHVITI